MKTWNRAMILVLALTAACASSPEPARAAKPTVVPPDLRGQWRLDHARSDDVQKKVQEAMANARPGSAGGDGMRPGGGPGGGMPPGGGFGGGPGGGMPPGGGFGGGPGGDMPDGDMPGGPGGDDGVDGASLASKMPHAPRTLESFTLEQAGDTLAFVDHGLRVRLVIVNDGHALSAVTADGVEQASGRWKKSRLVVESRGPRGGKNTETWELLNDGQTLRCLGTMHLPGAMGAIELNRIYARAAATRPAGDPPAEAGAPR